MMRIEEDMLEPWLWPSHFSSVLSQDRAEGASVDWDSGGYNLERWSSSMVWATSGDVSAKLVFEDLERKFLQAFMYSICVSLSRSENETRRIQPNDRMLRWKLQDAFWVAQERLEWNNSIRLVRDKEKVGINLNVARNRLRFRIWKYGSRDLAAQIVNVSKYVYQVAEIRTCVRPYSCCTLIFMRVCKKDLEKKQHGLTNRKT